MRIEEEFMRYIAREGKVLRFSEGTTRCTETKWERQTR